MNSQRNQPEDLGKPSATGDEFRELIQQARSGAPGAVDKLIERYQNYLLFIANQDVDPDLKTKLGASDFVQETAMQAQMGFDQFSGETEAEWKAWLRSILGNGIRNGRRRFAAKKRDAKREINLQDQSAVGRGLRDANLTPSSNAMEHEQAQAVKAAISQLKEDQQQAIRQRNFELLSFEEIGKNMGLTPDGARKLWARSIERLRQILAADTSHDTTAFTSPKSFDE